MEHKIKERKTYDTKLSTKTMKVLRKLESTKRSYAYKLTKTDKQIEALTKVVKGIKRLGL